MPQPPLPLDLPRLVMRRAFGVGLLVLLLATALGLQRAGDNIQDEVDAAMTLAGAVARLGSLQHSDDPSALASLRAMQEHDGLRHLELHIRGADGRALLEPPPRAPDSAWLGWLYELHRRLLSTPDRRQVSWAVPRPDGSAWTVSLQASHESERIEALNNLCGMLLLVLACIAGLLLVMRWNVRHALAPLNQLLAAIAGIEQQDPQAARQLPRMPIRELEAIASALRHLTQALAEAEARRRLLSQKVLTLQEDERAHLARELHDEFGQRLTALRFDAAWLLKRLDVQVPPQPELAEVVRSMAERCAEVQRDTRDLLVRLRPLGPASPADDPAPGAPLPLSRLIQLLQTLVHSWQRSATQASDAVEHRLVIDWLDAAGRSLPAALSAVDASTPADAIGVPRELALTVYRLSQEALTNAARHAGARQVQLRLSMQRPDLTRAALPAGEPAGKAWLSWSVADDGIGIADPAAAMQRGNGLGGMQERVWALGGEWFWGPFGAAALGTEVPQRPGLQLRAMLPFHAVVLPPS
ncbi:MAG: histidine kinase [Leptothrix sp. (in: b-proteobacteria)]